MTEGNNPKPTKKTSAVPLRKETVRVTLKANPSDNGNAGAAGSPPAPAPTISLKAPVSGPPAVPPPAPTAPTPPRAPKAPPTVKLQTGQVPTRLRRRLLPHHPLLGQKIWCRHPSPLR